MPDDRDRVEDLHDRLVLAEGRLAEAEDTLRAIRAGEVDALIVDGPGGEQVYTLRSSDQPYRAVVEQMQEGAAIVTAQGDVLYCNQRFAVLAGAPLETIIGGPIARFIGNDSRAGFDALMQAGRGTMQAELGAPGRRPFFVYLSLTSGVVDGVEQRTLVAADLTALVEAHGRRERAERENRAKDEFVAMLAHELRNPLGAIAAALQVLDREESARDATARATAVVRRQIDRLSRMMGDLLEAARANTGKIRLERRPTDWAALVAHHVAVLRAERIDRRIEADVQPTWIDADPDRVEQVVANLVGNAIKYTAPGGRIHISLGADADDAVLRVVDDGIGIEPELMPRIFELFAQGEQPLDRHGGGLGIGLTVVRRLVDAHGGRVTVESDGGGRGSTFTVRLPRIAAPVERPGGDEPRAPVPRRRVLIIEDNQDAREMHRLALEFAGHHVIEAPDGTAGLDLLRREPLDVALIDIGLPGMDGYEVARRYRSEYGRGVMLVALTGYGAPEDRERSRAAGFDEHLIKPVAVDAIQAVLRRASGDTLKA
jgi:signal transduction histidine kinase/ActR/RegA family two-component response regulator